MVEAIEGQFWIFDLRFLIGGKLLNQSCRGAPVCAPNDGQTHRSVPTILQEKMNMLAEELYGEFGFNTCTDEQQTEILKQVIYGRDKAN